MQSYYLKFPTRWICIRRDLHPATKELSIPNAQGCYLWTFFPFTFIYLDQETIRVLKVIVIIVAMFYFRKSNDAWRKIRGKRKNSNIVKMNNTKKTKLFTNLNPEITVMMPKESL